MKIIGARTLSYAAITTVFLSAGVRAEDHKPGAGFEKEFQAKAAYCQTCHALSAQGFRGSYPMPRLAGQQPQYIKNQLEAFIERRRLNPVMGNVAHVLSPAMVEALTTHFKDLDPPPLGGAPKQLVPDGEKIYKEGIPSAEVPACESCHGLEAKGDGDMPRLAGQLNDYVISKLTNWSKERGQNPNKPDNSAVMQPIASKLTAEQMAAVAAYVSYLK